MQGPSGLLARGALSIISDGPIGPTLIVAFGAALKPHKATTKGRRPIGRRPVSSIGY